MIKISKICGIKFHEKNSLLNRLTQVMSKHLTIEGNLKQAIFVH